MFEKVVIGIMIACTIIVGAMAWRDKIKNSKKD